jgi:SAM-dependent methyltransferase
MTWEELDWPALDRLRAGFLEGAPPTGPYWKSASDLASYDFTYGERIGWKWDHVLRELKLRGWAPASRTVFDWGCGSGVAARRVISFFGAGKFDSLLVWDHSPAACDFAAGAASQAFPKLDVAQATPGFLSATGPVGLLIISHVLNELPPEALAALRALVGRAEAVLWVEPGTHAVSRALGALREEFRSAFHVVAPCTHQNACPILAPDNSRDWCHHFAPAPSEIFATSDWVKFGQRAGIDLRSLPYCFLALDRRPVAAAPGLARVIGRPELFKPYARVLNCDAAGLAELTLLKRTDPALYKQLDRTKEPLVYRWRREGNSILGVET